MCSEMMRLGLSFCGTLLGFVLSTATVAQCAVVMVPVDSDVGINNAGFEADPSKGSLVDGDFSFASNSSPEPLPFWTVPDSSTGAFNPKATDFPSAVGDASDPGAAEGRYTSFTNGGSFSQELAETFDPLLTYTLTFQAGDRVGLPFGGYNVSLLAGATTIANVRDTDLDAPVPADGTFVMVSSTYLAAADLDSAAFANVAGELLTLRFSGRVGSVNGDTAQTNFDDVRLTKTELVAIPEPLAAGAGGLLGLVALRRRR